MPIVKITGPGLCAIGFSVALLWGCLIGERVITRRATEERTRVVRELEQLRRVKQPVRVSVPTPDPGPPPRFIES